MAGDTVGLRDINYGFKLKLREHRRSGDQTGK